MLALGPVIHNFITEAISLPWHFGIADTPDIDAFVSELRQPDWVGAVVTLPHKRTVIPLLDNVDDYVRALRACNGVWKRLDGSLVGTNTDWQGIYGSLVAATDDGRGKPALIIGAGGASRAAVYALSQHLDCTVIYVINRDEQEVADLLSDVKEGYASVGFKIPSITHVTSTAQASALLPPYYVVGTVPDFEPKTTKEILAKQMLVTFLQSPQKGVLLDMCYKPRVTQHIKLARENGWKEVDGVNIIAYQIQTQWTLWAGEEKAKQIPIKEAREALYRAATG